MNNATLIYKTYDRIAKSAICKKSPVPKAKKRVSVINRYSFF